jgi:phage-related protein|nr:MAG TPA: distal tail protein [Caudoviricetes sp.]
MSNYLKVNDFTTKGLRNCVVVDFGIIRSATPRFSEQLKPFGMNGSYNQEEGAYESYERTIRIFFERFSDLATLIEKFNTVGNQLEFSNQPDSLFYADFLDTEITQKGMYGWELAIKLDMQPFRYPKNIEPVVFSSGGTIDNIGTVHSEPVIEIEGNGDVSLTIGQKTMHLTVNNKATIDCRQRKQNIYNATGAVQNTLRKRGGFFEIPVGQSGVTFTGNVRKVTIRPNWRYKV